MNFRYRLFFFLLFGLPFLGIAQDRPQFDLKMGDAISHGYLYNAKNIIIGEIESGFLVQSIITDRRPSTDDWFLEIRLFDKNSLKEIKKEVLELTFKGKKHFFRGLIILEEKLYLITIHEELLYCQEIDLNQLQPSGDLAVIHKFSLEGPSKNPALVTYRISADESKILLVHNDGFSDEHQFLVFDANFELMWEAELSIERGTLLPSQEYFFLTNNGELYMDGGGNFLRLNEEGLNKYPVGIYLKETEGVLLRDYAISLGLNQEIYLSGRCTAQDRTKKSKEPDGLFICEFNPVKNQLEGLKRVSLPYEFLVEYSGEKDAKDGYFPGKHIVGQPVLGADGSQVILLEYYDDYSAAAETYYFNTVSAFYVDATGELLWAEPMFKRQLIGPGNGYVHASYGLFVTNGEIHFLFNDGLRTKFEDDPASIKNQSFITGKNANFVAITLNQNGEETREIVRNYEKPNVALKTSECLQISANEMIILADDTEGETFMIGKLTVQ